MARRQTANKADPQSQARDRLLRELECSPITHTDKAMVRLISVQPTRHAVSNGRAALAAAIQRNESKAR